MLPTLLVLLIVVAKMFCCDLLGVDPLFRCWGRGFFDFGILKFMCTLYCVLALTRFKLS